MALNPSEPFIRRPVMTTLVMVGLLFIGVLGYQALPVSYLPAVDFPTIQVTVVFPGASAETMASSSAAPLEREFSSIDGLNSMSSTSLLGVTQITLQFDLTKNIDAAAMDVQAAISAASGNLPENLPTPPTYEKVNPADTPIFYMTMQSETLPLSTVNEYARSFVTQSLSMTPGVAQVLIYGEKKYAVRVRLDPKVLAARGIGLNEVADGIAVHNVNYPVGLLEGKKSTLTLDVDGQLMKARRYRPAVIAYRDGQPVRLDELGRVEDGVEDDRSGSFYQGKPCLTIAIKRQPGSNTIAVVQDLRRRLDVIQRQLPASIDMNVIYDRSILIKEAVDDVSFTLILAVGLVILVVLVFLRSLTATLAAGAAVPLSIVTTFGVMHLLGFTLDTMSLLALTLAVGFVVDDAIVMLENIVRHLDMGKTPFQAALDGSKEVGFTILSMTLSLSVVFIPILFMAGIIGRVLSEFAVTIVAAILVSGVVSLTLTPMMCSRLLNSRTKVAESDPIMGRLEKIYSATLKFALNHRPAVMVLSVLLLAATVHLYLILPTGFLPKDDMGILIGYNKARQGGSYEYMEGKALELSRIIQSDPDVSSVIAVAGTPSQSEGIFVPLLKPMDERKASAEEILRRLWPKTQAVPGLLSFLTNPPMIKIGGRSTQSPYQYTLLSPDQDVLFAAAQKMYLKMAQLPGLIGVVSDLELNDPHLSIKIDRDQAAAVGLTAHDIEQSFFTAYGTRQASMIYAQTDQYKVITELLPQYQADAKSLDLLYAKSANGVMVPLSTVINVKPTFGAKSINHSGQLPSVTISFNTKDGVSLGQATAQVEQAAAETLPDTVTGRFEGEASAFAESMGSVPFLLFISIAVIYLILGILYESYAHPITILSGLPSAALGGLATLAAFKLELNLFAVVGVIMLIGIVKKNAIMVVDFALAEEEKGASPLEAAYQGCLVRFRPIMMTTLAAIGGAAPVALGFGAGAEARRPLGLVVVGGLVLSQMVTLYLTPVMYTYLDQLSHWRRKKTHPLQEATPVESSDREID